MRAPKGSTPRTAKAARTFAPGCGGRSLTWVWFAPRSARNSGRNWRRSWPSYPNQGGHVMATKLAKDTYPEQGGPNDFQCFGPPATRDGEFENTKICDMGWFTQDGRGSNKYHHGPAVQHKEPKKWDAYFEWART